ncbi:MAG TPA: transporter substrate-binding domain-containing protein [Azospirillaceae bacterium]|nr:transporter substrate-binding domain-containing protein [Azospirillaceae bacterium]
MSKRIVAAALMAAALLAGCGDDKNDAPATDARGLPSPIRIATEGAYPPFNYFDPSGKVIGLDIDIVEEMCRRLEAKCEITPQNWDGIIPGLQAGKYDAIIAGMSITDERRQAVAFTQGYATTPGYFVTLKDNPLQQVVIEPPRLNLNEIDPAEQAALDKLKTALKGKTVGVQQATIHANFLEKYLGDSVSIRRYDTQENLALDLASNRIDAGLADIIAWKPFLESQPGQNAKTFGPGLDGDVFGQGMGIALRKEDTKLLEAFNGALTAMKQDGTLKRLSEARAGFDASMP